MRDNSIDTLLDAIEAKEELSLRWGDVDASLSREELMALATRLVPAEDSEDLVEALLERVLIFEFDNDGQPRYRSRFAEAMRLLTRLRQIFPNQSWRGAPPLVADFRVDLRPRLYPRRDRDALEIFKMQPGLTPVQRAVYAELVKLTGDPPRIARFQEEAIARVLQVSADQGTIITAGTGSGKTLAFYLPALLRIAQNAVPNEYWVQSIAIYPRSELLKDQISEAYRMATCTRAALHHAGKRPIRLAALYRDTPDAATEKALDDRWRARRDHWVCPFLRCPACQGELIWTRADVAAGRERLLCRASCGATFQPDTIALTRDRILAQPPDILFTTTEMLNQRLSDTKWRKVFGIGQPRSRSPDLVLLDEVHTYAGASGAQSALTLRRWRALLDRPVSWVGLSATLVGAQQFFGDLAGLDPIRVTEITPAPEDLLSEGREYQIVLRGDPASRESLLSTTIQTAMLLGRLLDPPNEPSLGKFGRRLFAFTDDLDVANRLHDNLSDAEAYDRFGRPDQNRLPLAAERAARASENFNDRRLRDADGQRWQLPERIGRRLGDRLTIGRTTSRDPGVDGLANVIVATAALEVGFNDPLVGAVLQHKAPRSFAAFLQRRGRAGRDRRMRPLTITVLSDYGLDRHIFQSYELLFEPTLTAQSLFIRNQYILRMQAVYALLDWLADQERAPGVWNGWLWRDCAAPERAEANSSFRDHIQTVLGELLQNRKGRLDSLRHHLAQALRVAPGTVEEILWQPPRSLILEVVPTLLRRIFRNFELAWPRGGVSHDRYTRYHPLPEFIPRNLFSDLNLPEVVISLPPATTRDPETQENLPVFQALTQLAPGRVNRRFGEDYGGLAHWIPVPAGVHDHELPVDEYAVTSEYVGRFACEVGGRLMEVPVFRPWQIKLEKARATDVRPSSNARQVWASGFVGNGDPVSLSLPSGTVWRALVQGVHLYLHQFRASVGVRRFSTGAVASIRRPPAIDQSVDIRYVHNGQPAGIGFEIETDGMALVLNLPSPDALTARPLDPELERLVSAAYFQYLVVNDGGALPGVNFFERSWLRQVFLCASARYSLRTRCSLTEAAAALAASSDPTPFDDVLDALLGVQTSVPSAPPSDADDDADDDDVHAPAPGPRVPPSARLERLKNGLRALLRQRPIRESLGLLAVEAFGPPSLRRSGFLRRTLEQTLADAALAGVMEEVPAHAKADALFADVQTSPDSPNTVTIWITEASLGGAGVLQAVAETIAREPRRLFRAIESVLEPSDLETAASALIDTVNLLTSDADVAVAVARLRAAPSHDERARLRRDLLSKLARAGIHVSRAFAVSLAIRLLSPGTSPASDAVVQELIRQWNQVEDSLGVALEPREVALLAAENPDINRLALAAQIFDPSMTTHDRVATLWSMLWPRADALHSAAIASWNPFSAQRQNNPALVRALLLDTDGPPISMLDSAWRDLAMARLIEVGAVRLAAPLLRPELLRSAVVEFAARPIVVGHLKLYAVLERVLRAEGRQIAAFVLRERT